MNAPRENVLPPHTWQRLCDFLIASGSTLSVAQAADEAIRAWISEQSKSKEPLHGYQWKQLFLPEGTQLRMKYLQGYHFAQVEGDQLVFGQRAVTPRGMTQAISGDGRNAWRDLWLRMPGERQWINAGLLRSRLMAQRKLAVKPPETAAEALSAAAKAMGQALTAAVTLIEHVDHQSTTVLERRQPKNRRQTDLMEDVD
ncbi:hypothetical protein [Duganella qianjiadongensis]|uniref:Uncharacterized protein n=1 Tax=Duganella qianjiadongensis TaxID=2692176 RepID=A0ABW9VKW9_9BURK|nr:hypothetical protein [Duganella qianjiadongensis]MYM39352.1 hypothetical protein [Duganella qianjiadongensis]